MTGFKGTPLFGMDSSPHYTSKILAIVGTAVLWLIFLICMFCIKFNNKEKEFKEVKIILSSTPLQKVEVDTAPALAASGAQSSESTETQTSAESSAPAAEQKVAEQQTPAKPVEKPVEKTPAKQNEKTQSKPAAQQKPAAPAKTQTPQQEVKSAPQPFVPSGVDLTDGVDFGTKTSNGSKSSVPDWFYKDDFDDASAQISSTQNKVSTSSSATGTAGTTTSSNQSTKQSSQSTNQNTQSTTASSSTRSALEGIATTKFQGSASNGVTSESAVKAKLSGNGQYLMEMKGGESRFLLSPKEPKIDLSPEACKTINLSLDVTISFKVTPEGNISESSIVFSPSAILSDIVEKEIKNTLATWIFESAPNTSQASFDYHIKKI